MKKEDLIDAIGKIDDALLEKNTRLENRGNEKRKKPFFILLTALALVLAFFIQALQPPASTLALAQAEYPKLSPYPDEAGDWNEKKEEELNAWHNDQNRLRTGADQVDYKPYQSFFEKINKEIFKNPDDQNICFSPLNIYMATSMLAEVTEGSSRQEVLDLLGSQDMNQIRKNAKAIWLDNYQDDGRYTSFLANSFWLRKGDDDYKKETLDHLASSYYASAFVGEMGSDEYNQKLRDWINQNTKDLLKESANELKLDKETVMALVSTIYFKDAWAESFSKEDNTHEDFLAPDGPVKTDYMNATREGSTVCFADDFIASRLSFMNSGSMFFFRPDDEKSIDDVLNSPDFQEILHDPYAYPQQKELKVYYKIPKFDVKSDLDLIKSMQNLGLKEVFDPNTSDFSNLKKDYKELYLDQFKHAARVMIDEEGTEAAAYTVIAIREGATMLPEDLEEINFFLDKPFIFVITNSSGAPTFIGVINNPNL